VQSRRRVSVVGIGFLAVMVFQAAGPTVQATVGNVSGALRKPQFWALVVALLGAIIGAAVSDDANGKGWASANAVFCVLFILVAWLLSAPASDKETAWLLMALGICVTISPGLVTTADAVRALSHAQRSLARMLRLTPNLTRSFRVCVCVVWDHRDRCVASALTPISSPATL
jgi:hypothetical protein